MTASIKKHYPKALPFRAPEELASECDIWRRRTYWLMASATVIVALAIGAVVFVINDARAAKAPVPFVLVQEEAALEPAVELQSKPALSVTDIPVSPPNKLAKPPASISAKERLDAAQRERFLEVFGSLSAAHLFQTYLNIGLLADGVESEAYTTTEAEETLRSISDVMDQVDGQLEKLTTTGLDSADNAALEQIKAVTVMLRLQAKCLQDYWKTGAAAKAEEYHEVRKAAWKGLHKVLQVEAK